MEAPRVFEGRGESSSVPTPTPTRPWVSLADVSGPSSSPAIKHGYIGDGRGTMTNSRLGIWCQQGLCQQTIFGLAMLATPRPIVSSLSIC
ncbi:hypothetical protein J6590_010037 [Homalodisca vitripennis]|nr:hypothetical protein J6590_010037 [Homalodisca vitripennis]